MDLYLIRHGETEGNAGHFIQGWTEVSLTADGRQMALELGAKIREKQLVFDKIYCSDLTRARQTCALVFPEEQGRILYDERIREIDNTVLAGWHSEQLVSTFGEQYERAVSRLSYEEFGGEAGPHLMERVRGFLDFVAADTESKKIAAVTHGGIISAVMMLLFGKDFIDHRVLITRNASVTVIRYDPRYSRWRLVCFGNREEF